VTNLSAVTVEPSRGRAGWRSMLPRWSPKLGVGLVLTGLILFIGLIGPLLVGDPNTIRDISLTPPSGDFWLGSSRTRRGDRSTSACWSA
jgi:peptide/nickel transport system permease protein